jgi:opacity protein-like surface antigen
MKNLNIRLPFTLGLALALGSASLAQAQDKQPVSSVTGKPPQGDSRFEVGIAAAGSFSESSFGGAQTVKDYVENGTFTSSYSVGKAPGVAFDLQYNFTKKFGVRAGVQTFTRKTSGVFDAQVPHPFFFGTLRHVTGSQGDMDFKETALALTGVYRGGSGKWILNAEAGPAFFNVDATLADHLTLNEVYPYDTLSFNGVTTVKKSVSPFGFAVGLEFGRELTDAISIVAQGRFSQGTKDVPLNGQNLSIKAGGGSARIGLRFVAGRKKAGS